MAANEQHVEMPPGFPELWEGLTRARMDIAELKGMVKMHFSDKAHHTPPCATATGLQKTLHAAMGAAMESSATTLQAGMLSLSATVQITYEID